MFYEMNQVRNYDYLTNFSAPFISSLVARSIIQPCPRLVHHSLHNNTILLASPNRFKIMIGFRIMLNTCFDMCTRYTVNLKNIFLNRWDMVSASP